MPWLVDSITIKKENQFEGEASVKLVDEDNTKFMLFINKLIIDLHDSKSAVSVVKYQGVAVLTGSCMDELKKILLEIFQAGLSDEGPGLYELNSAGEIEKIA